MISFTFLTTSLIIVLIPGTGTLYTLSTGLIYGKTQSVFAAIGCTLGILPHLALSILSLSIFDGVNEHFLFIVKVLGSFYLLYMGINIFKSKQINLANSSTYDRSLSKIAINGASINLLNPKLTVFFLAFIPQFVNQLFFNIIIHAVILGIIFMLITLLVFIVYGMLASSIMTRLKNNPKVIDIAHKIFGIIFIFFAVQLGLSQL